MARCGRCRRCRSAPRRRPRAPAGAGPTPCGTARSLKEPPLPPHGTAPPSGTCPTRGHADTRMHEARSACTRVHNAPAVCARTAVRTCSPGCTARGLRVHAHTRTHTHAHGTGTRTHTAHAHCTRVHTRTARWHTAHTAAGPPRAAPGWSGAWGHWDKLGQTGANWGSTAGSTERCGAPGTPGRGEVWGPRDPRQQRGAVLRRSERVGRGQRSRPRTPIPRPVTQRRAPPCPGAPGALQRRCRAGAGRTGRAGCCGAGGADAGPPPTPFPWAQPRVSHARHAAASPAPLRGN